MSATAPEHRVVGKSTYVHHMTLYYFKSSRHKEQCNGVDREAYAPEEEDEGLLWQ